MRTDLRKIGTFESSFLSCEKDTESIIRKLFIESQPYSNILKRLLVINTKDCLENNDEIVIDKINEMSIAKLLDEGYIKLQPKIEMPEHEEVKAYIIITYDNFFPNGTNAPFYRDCTISFDIICHLNYWDIGDYRVRPLKIAGYIDGILNECKLSGIGTLNFQGMTQLVLNEDLAGYSLNYKAVHGNDDKVPSQE